MGMGREGPRTNRKPEDLPAAKLLLAEEGGTGPALIEAEPLA